MFKVTYLAFDILTLIPRHNTYFLQNTSSQLSKYSTSTSERPRKYKKKVKPMLEDTTSVTSSGQSEEQRFSAASLLSDKQLLDSNVTKERKKYKLKSLANKASWYISIEFHTTHPI